MLIQTWLESNDDCESPLGVDPLDEGEDGGDISFFSKLISMMYKKIINLF